MNHAPVAGIHGAASAGTQEAEPVLTAPARCRMRAACALPGRICAPRLSKMLKKQQTARAGGSKLVLRPLLDRTADPTEHGGQASCRS